MGRDENYFGLTDEQVLESREKNGANTTLEKSGNRSLEIFLDVVKEPLFILLLCAALIYFLAGEVREGIIMISSLSFVAGISLYQENKSKNAIDGLKKLNAPTGKVVRNGVTIEIPTEEIVIGDLVVVEDGNIVPCDCEIIKLNDFTINESILTGESLPVTKDLRQPDNIIYQGTFVMSGSCMAVAVETGAGTRLAKIGASLENIDQTQTPLQLQIKSFVRSMVIAGGIAFLIVWGIKFYTSGDLLHGLLHGLTLAMSILPEEIPVGFSTFMALGAYRLHKKKVIAKSPHTVETLGAATVICTDKTGTLTQNSMTIAAVFDFKPDKVYDYTKESFSYNEVIEYSMWASETEPFDQMEKSIHNVYKQVAEEDKRIRFKMIHEYPLSGKPPIMTHVFSDGSETIIACKGGVETVLKQCLLSDSSKAGIRSITNDFAIKGFRVLGVGRSKHLSHDFPKTQDEFIFEFIGLIAFYDPPKENISDTLKQFYDAGIDIKMITGDYMETAVAIADQIGLRKGKAVISGEQVLEMDQSALQTVVKEAKIFARMFPEAKLKVIEALKKNGEVVAMTGDGVNDAPALKSAHIGIAMGLRGSEVAKNAASLILVDDDLSHMTDAVALGRRIYENLKKAIQYIISIHIPIILIVTMPLILFWKFTDIFSPVHVIFLELIMGPTCSVVFENEPIEANSMTNKPRKLTSTFFSLKELGLSIIQGLVITLACLGIGYYYMNSGSNEETVRTIIYSTLIFSNVFLTLVNRSFYYSAITTLKYKNNLVLLVILISLAILFLSLYFKPIQEIFNFTTPDFVDLMICLIVAFAGVVWVEGVKKIYRINTSI